MTEKGKMGGIHCGLASQHTLRVVEVAGNLRRAVLSHGCRGLSEDFMRGKNGIDCSALSSKVVFRVAVSMSKRVAAKAYVQDPFSTGELEQ